MTSGEAASAAEFSLPIRVYIEDTDAGGIVYYVNYLKFIERARTEFMRHHGWDRQAIFNEGMMFVVHDATMRYRRPARLDDQLRATVGILRAAGATLELQQNVYRESEAPAELELLAEGRVTLACVHPESLFPRRIPRDMLAKLRSFPAVSTET